MCGICGILNFNEKVQPGKLAEMNGLIAHRGNDASGVWNEANIGFGHQRLSIIDLDNKANQPFFSADGQTVVTFNGEIYNFRELKQKFFDSTVLRTNSDTEILTELLARRGLQTFELLNGMFAFAFYDRQKKVLTCVRDRLGIKPFYYCYIPGKAFVFASEIKALLNIFGSSPLNDAGISDYLSLGYIPGEKTIFKNIKKLLPGHYLQVFPNGKLSITPYWKLEEQIHPLTISADEITELLQNSVKSRLVSDVPVATFLSSGIDSSAITALMTRNGYKPDCFTIGFAEKSFDESSQAANFAKSMNLRHFCTEFTPPSPARLYNMARHLDQPFADTSLAATWQLCENTAKATKVVLSGDGGDEIFGGYETCRADLLQLMMYRAGPIFKPLIMAGKFFAQLLKADRGKVSTIYKLKQFFAYCHNAPEKSHYSWRLYFDHNDKKQLLKTSKIEDSFNEFDQCYRSFSRFPILKQHLLTDIKTWLADDILFKADTCSMAHSLELRTPFLDHRLVETALSLKTSEHYNLFRTKKLLKKSLKNVVPDQVLKQKKSGFGCPISTWLETTHKELFYDSINSACFKNIIKNQTFIENMVTEQKQRNRDHGYRLWNLLMLSLWLQSH
jgi:asparagine synthase (glutamine-hydrolysing)